jgi:type IV secretion system protein VirB4
MIDAERREMFEHMGSHFESTYALVLQYLPPVRKKEAFIDFFYTDDGKGMENTGDRILFEFKKKVQGFEDGLRGLLSLRRMGTIAAGQKNDRFDSDELVNHLRFCLTGSDLKLRIPDCPMYLDSWMGYERLWTGDVPRLGDKFIACVVIDSFPAKSKPGVLSLMEEIPLPYRWSTRFIFLDQHEALAALNSFRRKWKQKVRGFLSEIIKTGSGVVNMDALSKEMEANQALSDAQAGVVTYGYYTTAIVLMNDDSQHLDEQARIVKKQIEHRGFHARIETVNTIEAWLGTLPGHAYPNVRRPLIHTLNLADLMPLAGIWPGLTKNPCSFYPDNSPPLMRVITTGSTPFRISLHVSDVGHTLVFGPTGAGKSTLLAILCAQFMRYRSRTRPDNTTAPATVTSFDKGYSLYALCSAVGGIHHDIGSDDSRLSLCPLAEIDAVSDALWAEEWIATCYELQKGDSLTPRQKKLVHEAIESMQRWDKAHRTMSAFVSTVQDADIHDALAHYTVGGGLGGLLDGGKDSLGSASFTVFEIDELMNLGDKNAIPVLLYLFRRFEKSLTGQPAMLTLDEAWVMLGHDVFREKVREWLKELRKKNCAVVLATQNISDASNSGIMDVLNEQCPTKILLPNKEAETPASSRFYIDLGLNQKEIEMLKSGQYKRQYYYRSHLGRRMFELGLGPLALSFVAISDKDAVREVKAYEKAHGKDWPLYWLEKNGVNYEKYIA